MGKFAPLFVFLALVLGFSAPLWAQEEPVQCAPKLDYASFAIRVEVISSGHGKVRLGDFTLVQNVSANLSGIAPEFENISAVIDYIGINLTCGSPNAQRVCQKMNPGNLRPHLIIRESRKDRVEYDSLEFNMSDLAYNEWLFGGRNYLFYLKDLEALGNCDYREGYFCADSTERNKCMIEKPNMCFVQVSPYFPGGYFAYSGERTKLCGCLPFRINAGGKCILPECIEGIVRNERCLSAGGTSGSRIVNTRCIEGRWRPDLLVSDCSARNLTCVYAANGTQPACTNFTCVDGTHFGSCSGNKPAYCSTGGRLSDDVARCGCPEGFYADLALLRCMPKACEDGTMLGNCSKTAPFMCIEGELVEMPDLCPNETAVENATAQAEEALNATADQNGEDVIGGNVSGNESNPKESEKQADESARGDNGFGFAQIAIAALAVAICIALYLRLKGGKKEPDAQIPAG